MDTNAFVEFMRKTKRSESTIRRYVANLQRFEAFLQEHREKHIQDVDKNDVEAFASWLVKELPKKAYNHMWALQVYFRFIGKEGLMDLASSLMWHVHHVTLKLKDCVGINIETVSALQEIGIITVKDMIARGKTKRDRKLRAEEIGVSVDEILELVKISDLNRIPGMAKIRARLYYDAGFDTLDKIAEIDGKELKEKIKAFIELSGFQGGPPNLAETTFTVRMARFLPRIIEY